MRSKDFLKKELIDVQDELNYLIRKNWSSRSHHWVWVTDEDYYRYDYLLARIKNIKINLNQIKMREMNKAI
jgi:hypothetical protein